mmetsp:Transcript_77689/g.177910  ORF Transcript_77689/g.177910 Transcript_77689/m.177910 type:complete len:200 (+) Transcript_77689:442-1041(+)
MYRQPPWWQLFVNYSIELSEPRNSTSPHPIDKLPTVDPKILPQLIRIPKRAGSLPLELAVGHIPRAPVELHPRLGETVQHFHRLCDVRRNIRYAHIRVVGENESSFTARGRQVVSPAEHRGKKLQHPHIDGNSSRQIIHHQRCRMQSVLVEAVYIHTPADSPGAVVNRYDGTRFVEQYEPVRKNSLCKNSAGVERPPLA